VRTDEVAPRVILDLDAEGNAVRLEVLDVRDRSAEAQSMATVAE